jgi:fructose-1-phosphate kinase PfkB-like protein
MARTHKIYKEQHIWLEILKAIMSSTLNYMLKLKETNNKLQSKLSNIQLKVSYIIETKLRTNITLQHKEGPKGTKLNWRKR